MPAEGVTRRNRRPPLCLRGLVLCYRVDINFTVSEGITVANQIEPDFVRHVDEALATTRSVRRKLDMARPVTLSLLLNCIDVAVQAPVPAPREGETGESWRFLVVQDPDQQKRIAALYAEVLEAMMSSRGEVMPAKHASLAGHLADMPALIFVCMLGQPRSTEHAGLVAWYGSVLPAAWSLMVALRARAIGATWTTLLSARVEELRTILGMPDDCFPMVMLPVAYMKGAVLRRAGRTPAVDVTFINKWGCAPGT